MQVGLAEMGHLGHHEQVGTKGLFLCFMTDSWSTKVGYWRHFELGRQKKIFQRLWLRVTHLHWPQAMYQMTGGWQMWPHHFKTSIRKKPSNYRPISLTTRKLAKIIHSGWTFADSSTVQHNSCILKKLGITVNHIIERIESTGEKRWETMYGCRKELLVYTEQRKRWSNSVRHATSLKRGNGWSFGQRPFVRPSRLYSFRLTIKKSYVSCRISKTNVLFNNRFILYGKLKIPKFVCYIV